MNTSSLVKKRQSSTALLGDRKSHIKYQTLNQSDDDHTAPFDQESFELQSYRRANGETNGNSSEKRSSQNNTVLITKEIQPSDSLRSLSLHYGCTINEIKRVNGLISDQDFYALAKIKIPVNRYSLLTIPEESNNSTPSSSSEEHKVNKISSSNQVLDTKLPSFSHNVKKDSVASNNSLSGTPNSSDSSESLDDSTQKQASLRGKAIATEQNNTNVYLKKLDKDIIKTVKKADLKGELGKCNESLDEVVSSMSSIQYYPADSPILSNKLMQKSTNGADCGLKWWSLILCFFLGLVIIGTLAVIEYYRSNN